MTTNNNNEKIKSVYDSKLMQKTRLESAKKMLEKSVLIYADKNTTFFGIQSSKEGFYSVKQRDDKKGFICNCFDYVHYIDIDPDHKCKHILYLQLIIKENKKIPVKDLSELFKEDKQ